MLLSQGMTMRAAMNQLGRSQSTLRDWRRESPALRAEIAHVVETSRFVRSRPGQRPVVGFSEFSARFLGTRVFAHAQNVVDLVEGRDPSWLHPAMTFERGEKDLILANMPPEHAKTTTITVNYVTYRICQDPNVRVLIVSKTQVMARKMLFAIKTRLTHPKFSAMIAAFGPRGGFDHDAEAWNQDMIYVSGDARDSGEKDPTVQALGMRGHVYGARADLVVLDDVVDLTNAHEYDKQIDWIQSEVISRISASGSLLVVGTRLSSKDLYSELRDPRRYPDETSPWTYLAMPAVLEFADQPKDWVTLWPRSDHPEPGVKDQQPDGDGLFPKWDGSRLTKKRARVSPRSWAMVYMQKQVADDAVFPLDGIKAAINGNRLAGPMPKGMVGCRPDGRSGLVCVAGLDPATAGYTAAVVVGLEPTTGKRFVLDVFNKPAQTPDQIRDVIKTMTDKYAIAEWRIEKNGFQGFLVHDREVNDFCASRGTIVRPHFTGANKHDADFGVASMTGLFTGWADGHQLVELPSTHGSEAVKALVEQLATWAPDAPKATKTDVVMALWFAELACRDRVITKTLRSHVPNPFLTPWDRDQQFTVSMADAATMWRPLGVA